jgi:hypothetical protein
MCGCGYGSLEIAVSVSPLTVYGRLAAGADNLPAGENTDSVAKGYPMFGLDTNQTIAVWAVGATLLGALVAFLTWMFKSPQQTLTLATVRKGVAVAVGFGLSVWVVASLITGQPGSTIKPGPGASPSVASNTTVPAPAASSTATDAARLQFISPRQGQEVGKVLPVTLKGPVPDDEQLWIVVQSSGKYFLQGKPDRQGADTWFLQGVNLGSNDSSDNGPYTILAVMASQENDVKLQQEFDATRGETGINGVPGGIGADPPSVTVKRTHL